MQPIVAYRESARTLETDVACFLLFVGGLLFLLEGTIHYASFFVTSHVGYSPGATALTAGSFAIGLAYLALGYSSWKSPESEIVFGFTTIFSGLLSASYFVVAIVESASPKLFSTFFSYLFFVAGYGSVTIFVELLIVFFSYRVLRGFSKQTGF